VKMQLLLAILALLVVFSYGQSHMGYWWWTWETGNSPGGTNIGIAFNGWANPAQSILSSRNIKGRLPGVKFISLGGGNVNGVWTASVIQQVNSAIGAGSFAGYGGIAYDIEEGDAGLTSAFQNSFRVAKGAGLRVLVSVSHSAPYNIVDGYAMMQAFFTDKNIDYLSPQLYTSGYETQNDYATSLGVGWDLWARSQATIIPSIVTGSLFSSAQNYFRDSHGFNITGYVQWAQT